MIVDWTINVPTIICILTFFFWAGQLRQIVQDLKVSRENHDRRLSELEKYREECHLRIALNEERHKTADRKAHTQGYAQ